ncbi:hypothetical protein CR513_10829, partial [Mucuna pruriens]
MVSALTKNEGSTTGISQVLPKKCRDPGIFSVPCTIGECTFADAMLDLGASINVMLTSIYRSLNFGDLEPTGMTIQLANRSIVQPLGVLEDVLVQVNELIFPTDFYVFDMEEETSGKESTLILRRPFLMTARTKIDVHAETLSMEFGDTLVQFNIFEAMKHPTENHSLFGINMIEELLEADQDEVQKSPNSEDNYNDVVDLAFETELTELLDQVCHPKTSECTNNAEVKVVETKKSFPAHLATIFTTEPKPIQVDQLDLKPLIEESPSPPPPLELKQLPNKLLKVLRQHKKAIGWKLSDLPGINPSICMHRILMKEEVKHVRQQQRRLNPTILDVVKKEVSKLLAAGIIYPISNNQWVNPVQVVPKKSGMTVMKNHQDELSWKNYQGNPIIAFLMDSQGTCKYILYLKINTKPPSPALLVHLRTLACPSACAMHRVHFNAA